MRIGSLCSGYGGLDLAAMHLLGGEVVWHADTDPGATAVLDRHWPGVPNHGDITTTDWSAVEPVDVVTAGYPCQPESNAGKRRSTEDERWIWPAVLAAIRMVGPRLVLLENVRGHLARGFPSVVGDLAGIGYDATWCVLAAAAVGAPHRRERVFVVATPQDAHGAAGNQWRWPAPGQAQGWRPRTDTGGRGGTPAPDASSEALRLEPVGQRGGCSAPVSGHAGTTAAHAPGDGRPRLNDRSSGSPVCPGRLRNTAGDAGCPPASDADGPGRQGLRPAGTCGWAEPASRSLADATGYGRHQGRAESAGQQGGPDAALGRPDPARWGLWAVPIARWELVTGRPAPDPTEPGRKGQPRLTPRLPEWMMGLPEGWVTATPGLSRNSQLRLIGNGVVPQQAIAAYGWLLQQASRWAA